jgi:hypothetical protein
LLIVVHNNKHFVMVGATLFDQLIEFQFVYPPKVKSV